MYVIVIVIVKITQLCLDINQFEIDFILHLMFQYQCLSSPYRDALESVTSLYNQVEEKLHMLVMRSNESLQHLEFVFRLREMEAKISTVLPVLSVCIKSLNYVLDHLKFIHTK